MIWRKILVVLFAIWSSASAQQGLGNIDFGGILNDLIKGDQFKNIQNIYSAIPSEFRDKLTKDLLTDPGKFSKEMLTMLSPQIQNVVTSFMSNMNKKEERSVDSNTIEGSSDSAPESGFDFSKITSMFGSLVSSNPQLMISMVQGLLQNQNYDSITKLISDNFDFDSILSMASVLGLDQPMKQAKWGEPQTAANKVMEVLKINELFKMWSNFVRSPIGQRINNILPRLLKSKTLPDALRLLEKETSFRFDTILMQLQNPTIRSILVSQITKPIGVSLKSIKVPADMKQILTKADEILNQKLNLGIKVHEFIEPALVYIRDRFKLKHKTLLDFKASDIEFMATEILNKEILDPLGVVYESYVKAKEHTSCSQFIYCQLNYNYYDANFIQRNIVKLSSIISGFQLSTILKKRDESFSELYESVYKGVEGSECTMGVTSFCLDLMHTASHNEL